MVDIILYSGGLPVDGRPIVYSFYFYSIFHFSNRALCQRFFFDRIPLHSSSAKKERWAQVAPSLVDKANN